MDTQKVVGGSDALDVLPFIRDMRVVTIGGGTGPFALLSRLKQFPCTLTAIVSMADSGGSSRRLMDEYGLLPVGDLRQALVALSRRGALWRGVYGFRFPESQKKYAQPRQESGDSAASDSEATLVSSELSGVGGHSLGNLIIMALQAINNGNLLYAIQDAQELLDTAGRVFPVTLAHTTLCAELANGQYIRGETEIDTREEWDSDPRVPISRIYLEPAAPACDEALRAIRRADIIVIGPGDLYTSVLPNLLVEGVAEAIRSSDARKVYVCNLMTKRGETDGYSASKFVAQIHRYLEGRIDRVVVHNGSLPEHLLAHYAGQQQFPVEADLVALRAIVPEVNVDDLVAIHGQHLIRHDADRLIEAIFTPTMSSSAARHRAYSRE